jgi:Lrp/AsnC family leucine-responsive transcriptional regulator
MEKIDKFDKEILRVLQEKGRISNQDLADEVGLSPSPCLRRVKLLEEKGIIQSYRAVLDTKRLGLGLLVIVHISMDKHTPDRLKRFENEISMIPEVIECLLITGQTADYVMKVLVEDLEQYQNLLLNKITVIQGVTGIHSSFVLKKIIDKPIVPV